MKKIRTTVTAGLASLGLIVGTASFAGAASGTIGTTGPDSYNKVSHKDRMRVKVRNNNDIRASNHNDQSSSTGNARVSRNTSGGSARTGDAENANSLNATVAVENRSPVASAMAAATSNDTGSITNTGPDSTNVVRTSTKTKVEVENNNDLEICNTNMQTATSGDASVTRNTTGGSATTGNASNTNSTTMNFKVTN